MTAPAPCADRSSGGRLVAADGRELPLKQACLEADARAGLARVRLEQRFANPHDEPLEVVYSLPLPHDAAVAGFAFRIGDRRVVGEVDRREQARERYEEALMAGRSASLLEQERGSLFTQSVGNVPPGEEVVVEVSVDQPLAWLDEGAWEWRFPTVVGARYLGAEGRTPDAERVYQDVSLEAGPSLRVELLVRDEPSGGGAPTSPSHELEAREEEGAWRASVGGDRMDRDVVVRWAVASPEPGLSLDLGRGAKGEAHGLLTVVPPLPEGPLPATARDLILLIDTSGSMGGEPLRQARRVATALVESLGDEDSLEMIEFSMQATRWKERAVRAGEAERRDAVRWIEELRAGGCTEMRSAVEQALRPLGAGRQRQVVLITDGFIGFESEVVRAIRDRLPAGSRLHGVGVGPAANRSLLGPAARAGRGVEALVGLHEGVEGVTRRLLARTARPLVTELEVEGDALLEVAPKALPDLFAGAPARIALRLRPEGGRLFLRGRSSGGEWTQTLRVPACAAGEGSCAAATLFARERVEDLEIDLAAGAPREAIDAEIERLGLAFQVATRLTSWVAVSEEPGVDPREPVRRVRQPQQLPQGLSAEGLGLRAARSRPLAAASMLQAAVLDVSLHGRSAMPEFPLGAPRSARRPGPPAASRPPQSESRLRASVRRHRDGRLVLELHVEGEAYDWKPPRRVRLHLAHGEPVKLRVDGEATTRAGRIEPGASIRLVLELPDDELPAAPVTLMLKAGWFGEQPVTIGGC